MRTDRMRDIETQTRCGMVGTEDEDAQGEAHRRVAQLTRCRGCLGAQLIDIDEGLVYDSRDLQFLGALQHLAELGLVGEEARHAQLQVDEAMAYTHTLQDRSHLLTCLKTDVSSTWNSALNLGSLTTT